MMVLMNSTVSSRSSLKPPMEDCPSGGQMQDCQSRGQIEGCPSGGQMQDCPSGGQMVQSPSGGQMEGCPSGGQMEDCQSGVQMDDCQSGGQMEDCPSGGQMEGCPSGGQMEGCQSGVQMEDCQSGVQMEGCQSGGQMDDCQSGGQMEDCPSGGQMEGCQSGVQMEGCQSGGQMEDCQSGGQMDDCQSGGQMDDCPSGGQMEGCPSGGQMEGCQSGVQMEDCQSGVQMEGCQSGGQMEDCRSGGQMEDCRSGGQMENCRSGGQIEDCPFGGQSYGGLFIRCSVRWRTVHPVVRWRAVHQVVRWRAVHQVVRWRAVHQVVRWRAVSPVVRWRAVHQVVRWRAVLGSPSGLTVPLTTSKRWFLWRLAALAARTCCRPRLQFTIAQRQRGQVELAGSGADPHLGGLVIGSEGEGDDGGLPLTQPFPGQDGHRLVPLHVQHHHGARAGVQDGEESVMVSRHAQRGEGAGARRLSLLAGHSRREGWQGREPAALQLLVETDFVAALVGGADDFLPVQDDDVAGADVPQRGALLLHDPLVRAPVQRDPVKRGVAGHRDARAAHSQARGDQGQLERLPRLLAAVQQHELTAGRVEGHQHVLLAEAGGAHGVSSDPRGLQHVAFLVQEVEVRVSVAVHHPYFAVRSGREARGLLAAPSYPLGGSGFAGQSDGHGCGRSGGGGGGYFVLLFTRPRLRPPLTAGGRGASGGCDGGGGRHRLGQLLLGAQRPGRTRGPFGSDPLGRNPACRISRGSGAGFGWWCPLWRRESCRGHCGPGASARTLGSSGSATRRLRGAGCRVGRHCACTRLLLLLLLLLGAGRRGACGGS